MDRPPRPRTTARHSHPALPQSSRAPSVQIRSSRASGRDRPDSSIRKPLHLPDRSREREPADDRSDQSRLGKRQTSERLVSTNPITNPIASVQETSAHIRPNAWLFPAACRPQPAASFFSLPADQLPLMTFVPSTPPNLLASQPATSYPKSRESSVRHHRVQSFSIERSGPGRTDIGSLRICASCNRRLPRVATRYALRARLHQSRVSLMHSHASPPQSQA